MSRRALIVPAAMALVLLLSACGAEDPSSNGGAAPAREDNATTVAAESTTTTTRLDVELVPATTKVPLAKTPVVGASDPDAPPFLPGDDPVAYAIADLAFRLGVGEDDIELVEQQEVMWRDGSVGCPQPGFNYTQALVDGSRIVLTYDGVTYSYHVGRGLAPFWCENPAE